MEQKLHDARRYPASHRTRTGTEIRRRDPSLCLISTQILICILLALIGWAAVKTNQPFLLGARERYEELLTGEFDTQTAKETAARVVERLTEPRGVENARESVSLSQSDAKLPESAPPDGGAAGNAVSSSEDVSTDGMSLDGFATPSATAASTDFDAADPDSTAADVNAATPDVNAVDANRASSSAFIPPITDTDEPAAKSGGAGGRMLTDFTSPRGDEGQPAPASCSFAPIVVSARVEPPCGGTVSSEYGYRKHPISGADDFHRGVDIATAQGDAVRAALPGRVSEINSSAIYGNFITLDHGGGLFTTYSHCDTIIAELGANMRQGEMIATVGNTGISTGPHVHFEISRDGKYYNPAWVLDRMSADGN